MQWNESSLTSCTNNDSSLISRLDLCKNMRALDSKTISVDARFMVTKLKSYIAQYFITSCISGTNVASAR